MQLRQISSTVYFKWGWGKRLALCCAVFITAISIPSPARAELSIHWRDTFTIAEREKLTTWVSEVNTTIESLVGPLPYQIHLRFYRRDRAREPVPWANTRRGNRLGIDFHVDPRYSLDAFRKDWTAAHEFSHLILPYLGSSNAWFAEGFASFMQYQVMETMGVLSREEKRRRYLHSLNRARRNYAYAGQPFTEATRRLRREGKYSLMYWGGAVYFLQINDRLVRTRRSTLIDVLRAYVACCRRNYDDLQHLIEALDGFTNSRLFSQELERFKITPGFPRYQHLDLAK